MNSTPYFEAWKHEKSQVGIGIKPGRRLKNLTQAQLRDMIGEFTQSVNSLGNNDKVVRQALSARNKNSKHKWDCEAAKLEKPYKTYVVVIFKRKMTLEELQEHERAQQREQDVQDLEQGLEDREQNVQDREQDLEDREQDLEDREQNVEVREQNAEVREQDVEVREQNVGVREQNVGVREQAVGVHEQNVQDREHNVEDREQDVQVREQNVQDREQNVQDREQDLESWEQDLEDWERDLEAREQNDEDTASSRSGRNQSVGGDSGYHSRSPIPKSRPSRNHRGRKPSVEEDRRPRSRRNPSPTARLRGNRYQSVGGDSGYHSRSEREDKSPIPKSRASRNHRDRR